MRIIIFALCALLAFSCVKKPTAQNYAQQYRAAASLPVDKMLVEMDRIGIEAQKNLPIDEYVKFCQEIADVALEELQNVNDKSMEEYERAEEAIDKSVEEYEREENAAVNTD